MSKVTAFYWVGISVGIGLSLLSLAVSLLINRRRAQRERDLFASSLDTLPIARQIVSPDGKVVFTSTAFRQMFPSVDKPVKTTLAAQLVGEPDEADRLARLEAQAAVGIAGHAEVTVRMANGGVEWRDVSASPLQLLPGYVVWGVEDVTPRRQVEALIRREQERFADLVERAPIGFYSVDETGRFQFINATLSNWLGIPRADVAAGRVYLQDLLAPPVAPDTPPYSPFAGEVTGGEVTLRGPEGKTLHAYIRQEVVPSDSGSGLRTRSVVHDLGRERALEAALRSSEQRFQRFFAEAPIGIVLIDQGGRVQECNAHFRTMVGVQSSDLVGFEFLGFIDEQDRPAVSTRLSAANASGPGTPVDVSLKSLQPRKSTLYISPRDTAVGETAGWIAHFIDITERKNLEVQVAQSQKMQAVGQLAGGIAHDFNNLLTAMIGFCDLLLVRHRAGDQSFADIMQIKQNANRAANLVRQLLAFSRQQTLQPRVLNITDVLAELSHLLRRLIGENIELKMTHGRDLSPVKVDHGQLEQVIINLAVNARDAMIGGGTLTIRTENVATAQPMTRGSEIMPPGSYVMVQVIDTGHGIPPGIVDRIFDPFFSTKEVGSGTGLGLSTVYGIVKQTGGFIFVESKPKQGATFSIYLPRHVPGCGQPRAGHRREHGRSGADRRSHGHRHRAAGGG